MTSIAGLRSLSPGLPLSLRLYTNECRPHRANLFRPENEIGAEYALAHLLDADRYPYPCVGSSASVFRTGGMELNLRKVFVVPAGEGHLTNAYGMSIAIALTDSFGQHVNDRQMDFVVAHEVAHVKLKHGRNTYCWSSRFSQLQPSPFFSFRSKRKIFTRSFSDSPYSCPSSRFITAHVDSSIRQTAKIKFTHAPQIGVQVLAKLHQSRELLAASDAFTELFMTHPTFAHRVGAIVKYGQIPADRLPLFLEEAGKTVTAAHTSLEEDQKAS